MAAVAAPLAPTHAMRDDHVMDTRTPSPVPRTTSAENSNVEDAAYKPDLSAEVALLSTKLVNAINYQTNLDDSLQQSRHELETARQRVSSLEAEKQRNDEMVTNGILVKRADVERTILKLRQDLAAEKAARMDAERAKKQTENELENLTSALFEEANSMVAAARKETEAAEKKHVQLRSQIKDNEVIIASQNEQLHDLKDTMQKQLEQSPAIHARDPSMPSTPIISQTAVFDALQLSTNPDAAEQEPEHPLHFSQLISPVLRNDITSYADFQDLLLLARRMGAHSRSSSQQNSQGVYTGQPGSNTASMSSPNLPGAFSFNASPNSAYNSSMTIPPLKDSKFYKRVLTEDIEPTLRLDLAPGLSFLSRRTVLGSLLQGTLAVEPYPQNKHYFACTLCGESRRNKSYVRKYRFRTSEDDNVSKPICDYCLHRLRSTCDFAGFLRMCRDGHWKCDSEEDQEAAWEESVRLRERMFWARVGGGVVPCLQQTMQKHAPQSPSSVIGAKSTSPSLEGIPEGVTINAQGLAVEPDGASERTVPSGRPTSIALALVGTPKTAASVSNPDLQHLPKIEQPSEQLQSELEAQADDGAENTGTTTPFEDARENEHDDDFIPLNAKLELVSSGQRRDSEGTLQQHPSSPRNTSPVRQSIDTERPGPMERTKSSVLARVKAMEAANSSSSN